MMTVVAFTTAMATELGLEAQLADGLAAHQRDDAVRSALQLDLGHDPVRRDLGDDAHQAVARRATHLGRVGGQHGVLPGERGEREAVDHAAPGVVLHALEQSEVDPATDGVVAHAEERRRVLDPHLRHDSDHSSEGADVRGSVTTSDGPPVPGGVPRGTNGGAGRLPRTPHVRPRGLNLDG
jgi:hypothetical protein